MYSNEQVKTVCKELMKEIQGHINNMENELAQQTPNLARVGTSLGKLSKAYVIICNFTGIWSGVDFREGGFKESKEYMPEENEEVNEGEGYEDVEPVKRYSK